MPQPIDRERAQSLVTTLGVVERDLSPTIAPVDESEAEHLRAVLGSYRIEGIIARGGFGAVYKGKQRGKDVAVAIKILPRSWAANARAVARFQREIEIVSRLDDPRLVKALDFGCAEGTHFLVMEYIDGVNLGQLAGRGEPLASADACELIRQAALGVQAAHDAGLVHRDLKPSNMILTAENPRLVATAADGEPAPDVKILDFGLCLEEDEGSAQIDLTLSEEFLGSVDYTAPEQIEGAHHADARSDVYGLGATLYKLLSGFAPFEQPGDRLSFHKKLLRKTQDTPVSISQRCEGLPRDLEALVDRQLARDPADRPATAAEVAAALEPFTEGADLAPLLDSATARIEKERKVHIPTPGTTTRRKRYKRVKRHRTGITALAFVLAAIFLWARYGAREAPGSPGAAHPSLPVDGIVSFTGVDADDALGAAIAVSSSTLIAGAPRDNTVASNAGGAYLHDLHSGQQIAKLLPSGGTANDHFGAAVATHGEWALVGAPHDDIHSPAPGAAYLFKFNRSGAQEVAVLTAPGIEAATSEESREANRFGRAVAVNSQFAVVGASNDGEVAESAGAAYLYDITASPPRLIAKLTASDGIRYGTFGRSVALSGSRALIGAPGQGTRPGSSSGAAYLFDLSTSPPAEIARLTHPAPEPEQGAWFGHSVALEGNIAVIGAPKRRMDGLHRFGAAYVFDLAEPRAPFIKHRLLPPEHLTDSFFGCSVGIAGDRVVVGMSSPDLRAGQRSVRPAVCLFDLESGWQLREYASDKNDRGASFGYAAAIGDAGVFAGAFSLDDAGPASGAVFRFQAPPPLFLARLTAPDPVSQSRFGSVLVGDGRHAVIGRADNTPGQRGPALTCLVEMETDQGEPRISPWNPGAPDRPYLFGGGISRDGSRLVISTLGSQDQDRRVEVIDLAAGPPTAPEVTTVSPVPARRNIGSLLAMDGDTVAIASRREKAPPTVEVLALGGVDQIPEILASLALPGLADMREVSALAVRENLVLAADLHAEGNGAVHVFDLQSEPPGQLVATLTASDGEFGDNFGAHLALSGSTLLIGAPGHELATGQSDRGAVYLFDLSSSPPREIGLLDPPEGIHGSAFGKAIVADDSLAAVRSRVREGNASTWAVTHYDLRSDPPVRLRTLYAPSHTDKEDPNRAIPLALAGGCLLIASPAASVDGQPNAGAVYVYDLASLLNQPR